MVIRALKKHRRIKRLFKDTKNPGKSLNLLEEELQAHNTFEERILFNDIQKIATVEELQKIEEIHMGVNSNEDYPDPFWEKS